MGASGARAVMASEDEDLDVRFYAGGRVFMGGETKTLDASVPAMVRATDPDFAGPFVVRVYRGKVGGSAVEAVFEQSLSAGAFHPIDLAMPEAGTWFFYVEIHELSKDRMAWTAPIWIERL
jgi:hypothetical protein